MCDQLRDDKHKCKPSPQDANYCQQKCSVAAEVVTEQVAVLKKPEAVRSALRSETREYVRSKIEHWLKKALGQTSDTDSSEKLMVEVINPFIPTYKKS
jgi:hypothetical protein